MSQQNTELASLTDAERHKAVETILAGCKHIYSKGRLQQERMKPVLDNLMYLAEKDPIFLAHFTSYAATVLKERDLQVLTVFANSLNAGDGTPFSPGSKYKKPNFRLISQAALQNLDIKNVNRVVEIANLKQTLGDKYKEGTHFAGSLRNAVYKYVKFRESSGKALEGIRKAGLKKKFQNLYRSVRTKPSPEAAQKLGWQQKKGPKIKKEKLFDFTGKSDLEIAETIREKKIPALTALGILPEKISPVIAAAVLEQATPNQAVILRSLFDSQGLLKDKEILKMFAAKVKGADALDRVERINKEVDVAVQQVLKSAKSDKRKSDVGNIGKVSLQGDISGSMDASIPIMVDVAATLAEAVQNPKENLNIAFFNARAMEVKLPESYEKDAFAQAWFGMRASSSTNCFAYWPKAREYGCDIDFFVTDGGHTDGNGLQVIDRCRKAGYKDPSAVVIVKVGNYTKVFANILEAAGIPYTEVEPKALKESALVSQVIRTAAVGKIQLVEEIMATPLLKLPDWWASVS
jgi:hypothetical protein